MLNARGPPRLRVRGVLELVVERCQRLGEAERRGDQPVGEPGVLGKQRAVQVGADHVARARRPRVRRRRCCRGPSARARAARRRPEECAPAVVLEAGEHAAATAGRRARPRSRRCRSAAGPSRADRVQVDQADAGQRLGAQLVGVAEQLVAAAHGEDHRAAARRPRAARRACARRGRARTASGRGPGRRRCSRCRRRRDQRLAEARGGSRSRCPRHWQRRSSMIRLPRSA